MPTNPIPAGSCNLPVNMPRVARAALGRLAFTNGKYVGEFVRGLLKDRLEEASRNGEISSDLASEAVAALAAVGRRAKSAASLACILLVCLMSLFDGMARGNRRAARRPNASIVRLLRSPARKIGESEARPS